MPSRPTRRTKRPAKRAAPARAARAGARKSAASGKKTAAPQPDRRKRAPETLRLRSLQPTLTVDDIQRSVRFYSDVLGFFVGEQWKDDGGVLRGVRLKAGVCVLGLSQDDWAKGRDRKKGDGVRVWCETAQDVDALATRIKAAGVRLTEGPTNQPWGARSLSVDDPDGYHLTIFRQG